MTLRYLLTPLKIPLHRDIYRYLEKLKILFLCFRLGTDEEDNVEETPEDKKKIWKADVVERWGHDKFAEFDQEPKSKDELVESYGYDIRNEDNAPRARRRRRYGRGPNKYTRNWEDEDAYSKPVAGQKPRNPGSKDKSGNDQLEDFPALPSRDENDKPNKSSIKSESLNSELKPAVVRDVPRASADREDGFRHDRRGRGNDDGMRSRGRGGRGMRGGGYEQSRRGGDRGRGADRGRPVGFGRGGYEDRKRYNDRHGGHDDRGYEDEYRGGRGGRSRGRGSRGFDGMEQKQGRRHIKDPGLTPRTEELGDQVANLDINKENENSVPRGSKRYSHQRKGGIEVQTLSSEQQNLQEMLNEGINPAMCSGPPSGAPFQSQIPSQRLPHNNIVSHSGVRPVPAAYIQTSQIMNFNPQYPVPVTVSAVSLPMGVGGVPLATIPAMTSNGGPQIIGPGFANGPDAVMLAAAQPGPDGFAAVRGGVTYFNPTAQNILPQRPVSKRPKAAIPIVDPSVVETKDYIVESSRQELPSQL